MKVVILCGGENSSGMTECPRPLVRLSGIPLVLHVMRRYAHFGYKDFILCLGDHEVEMESFLDTLSPEEGFAVEVVDTAGVTENHGRVLRVQERIDDDLFMVTRGDGFADIDFHQLVRFHRVHGKIATVSTVLPGGHRPAGAASRLREPGRVDSWMTAGFFVFHRDVFDLLDSGACQLGSVPLDQLIKSDRIVPYRHDGFYITADDLDPRFPIDSLSLEPDHVSSSVFG